MDSSGDCDVSGEMIEGRLGAGGVSKSKGGSVDDRPLERGVRVILRPSSWSSERKDEPREPREMSGRVFPWPWIVEASEDGAGECSRLVKEETGGMMRYVVGVSPVVDGRWC